MKIDLERIANGVPYKAVSGTYVPRENDGCTYEVGDRVYDTFHELIHTEFDVSSYSDAIIIPMNRKHLDINSQRSGTRIPCFYMIGMATEENLREGVIFDKSSLDESRIPLDARTVIGLSMILGAIGTAIALYLSN